MATEDTTRHCLDSSLHPHDLVNQLRQQLPEPALPSTIQADIHNLLYASYGPKIDDAIVAVERATEMKREKITSILIGVLALALVMGGTGARFVCNIIGIAYPAYASLKAVRSLNALEEKEWLVYWSVFGLVTLIDFWLDIILQFFPFYYVVKSLFYLYLYLPYTRGADLIFLHHLEPLICSVEHKVTVSLRESVARSQSVLHSSLYSTRPSSIASLPEEALSTASNSLANVVNTTTPEVKSEETKTLKAEPTPENLLQKEGRSKITPSTKKTTSIFRMWPFG